jgi:hypothetical protein
MRASPLISDIPVIFLTAKVLPTQVAHFLFAPGTYLYTPGGFWSVPSQCSKFVRL